MILVSYPFCDFSTLKQLTDLNKQITAATSNPGQKVTVKVFTRRISVICDYLFQQAIEKIECI